MSETSGADATEGQAETPSRAMKLLSTAVISFPPGMPRLAPKIFHDCISPTQIITDNVLYLNPTDHITQSIDKIP